MQKSLPLYHKSSLISLVVCLAFGLLFKPAVAQKNLDAKGWTVIDTAGHIYSNMLNYSKIYEYHKGAAIAHDGKSWMLIDRYGNCITNEEYSDLMHAGDNLWVCGQKKKFGIIDSDGIVIKPPTYEQIFGYGDGKMVIKKGNSYGYINLLGEIVIAPKYDMAAGFVNGYAVVMKKDKYGLIDPEGNLTIPLMYKELLSYKEDLMAFSGDGKLFGYIDINNDTIIEPQFTFASSFRYGRAHVATDTVKRRKFVLRSDTTRFYINRGGYKAENQKDSISFDVQYLPSEIDSVSWTFVSQNEDTLFSNKFYYDQLIQQNNFGEDAGLVAVYISTSSIKRPDQSGKSLWGEYSFTDYKDGYYKLVFENLQNSFSVIETERGEVIISTSIADETIIDVRYRLLENRLFLDTVWAGQKFFDPNEIEYQQIIGRHYINYDLSYHVLSDLFINLFMPMYKYQSVEVNWSKDRSGGSGMMLSRGGTLFIGKVSDSLKNGTGKLMLPDMFEIFKGMWANDLKQGRFEIYTTKGSRISANFTNDLADGEWYIFPGLGRAEKVVYQGGNEKERIPIRNSTEFASGLGDIDSYTFKTMNGNNEYYAGFVKKNERFLWGKYQYNDGSSYNGEWQNHIENGYGVFKWSDGETYSGTWVDGNQMGKGTNLYPGGSRYDGEFRENLYHGFGIFRYKNGNIIKGTYHNGVVHDTSEITFVSGKIEQRVYDFGKVVSKEVLKPADELVGIGLSFRYDQRNHDWIVVRVGRKRPADISGLKPDDIIKKVDGEPVEDKKQIEVRDMIKGLAGTIVTITIFRDGLYQDIEVIRDAIEPQNKRVAQQ